MSGNKQTSCIIPVAAGQDPRGRLITWAQRAQLFICFVEVILLFALHSHYRDQAEDFFDRRR